MGEIYHSVTELIGNTPLLELSNYQNLYNLDAKIISKIGIF